MNYYKVVDKFLFSLLILLYGCFLIYEFVPIFKIDVGDELNINFFIKKISIQFYAGLTFIIFGIVNLIEY